MKKLYKLLKNPWLIGIATPVISTYVLKIIDIIAGTHIYEAVIGYLKQIISFKAPLGLIFILIFIILAAHLFFKQCGFYKFNQKNPFFLAYTTDIFHGISYRWEYSYTSERYKIGNIIAYCPDCNCRIFLSAGRLQTFFDFSRV